MATWPTIPAFLDHLERVLTRVDTLNEMTRDERAQFYLEEGGRRSQNPRHVHLYMPVDRERRRRRSVLAASRDTEGHHLIA